MRKIEGDLKMEKSYSGKIKEYYEQEKETNKVKTAKLLELGAVLTRTGASTLLYLLQKKQIDKLNNPRTPKPLNKRKKLLKIKSIFHKNQKSASFALSG